MPKRPKYELALEALLDAPDSATRLRAALALQKINVLRRKGRKAAPAPTAAEKDLLRISELEN